MSTYTKKFDDIYFLNDKNIVQDLHGKAQPDINAIPSLSLLQDSYEKLSGYSNSLCVSLSNTISEINKTLTDSDTCILLSVNGISAKVNQICSDISVKVDNIELSVNDLSNAVENKFVHKSGDTIAHLTVNGSFKAQDLAEIDGNAIIHGSLIQGEAVKATKKGGIALGISAEAIHTNSFVWNGNDNIENYQSHGEHGTFNINPENGVNGFYIGEKTLCNIISNDVKEAYYSLSAQLHGISTELCTTIDTRRAEDKAELSDTLSSYANGRISELCTTVNTRRAEDKAELSDVLSSYANELCVSLSNTIENSGFANYKTFEFNSLTNDHVIQLVLKDNYGHSNSLSIDTTDFIKNRILDSAEVIYDKDGNLVLRLYWEKPSSTSEGKFTDIKIADLAKIYKEGDGISITPDLRIIVDDTIARMTALNSVSGDVLALSTSTIPVITTDVNNIQKYIDNLSVDRDSERGIILQLSDAIKLNANNISSVSTSFESISTDITSNIDDISSDVETIKNFDNMLCSMHTTAEGEKAVGVIPDIRHDISLLGTEIRTATNYAGTITLNKYHPDWFSSGYGNYLSSIFKWANLAIDDQLKNGNLYQIEFTPDTYEFSNTTFAADQSLITEDGFVLHHKDWLYIATGDSTTYVQLTSLTTANVHHIQSVQFDEYHQLSNIVRANYPWLAGNNTRNAQYEISVQIKGRVPEIVTATGHAFGQNNDFEGNNRFYRRNYFLEEQTDFNSISCRGNISADATISAGLNLKVADNMIVDRHHLEINNISVDGFLSVGYELSVGTKVDLLSSNVVIDKNGIKTKYDLTADADIYATDISVGGVLSVDKAAKFKDRISSDWSKTVNANNGYSLLNLSTDLSNKIWIKDPSDPILKDGKTSDLSIVKIDKKEYDEIVAMESVPLCSNVLYIVSSDYMDAYGQVLSNLVMTDDSIASEATNKHYVDNICADLSSEIQKLSTALSNDIDNLSADLSSEIQKLSTALSNDIDNLSADLSSEISVIRHTFADLYTKISIINENSLISDVISAVVSIKNAIGNLTAY